VAKRLGNVVVGHVLDVNKKYLEKALKHYDKQLYLKWNARKNEGNGCWEVRRTPNQPVALLEGEWQGRNIFVLDYVENDIVHHILDVPFLNYDILTRIKEMDAWNNPNLVADNDYKAQKMKEEANSKHRAELRYQIGHFRKQFAELQEETRSGRNPLKLLSGQYKSN
jgi:hypothetical protein